MEQVRKITARAVGVDKGAKAIGQSFVVIGRVLRAVPDSGDYGEFVRLKGQFRAVNEDTGEEFGAPVFIAPGGLLEYEIATTLNASDQGAVEFAARFKLVEADNAVGCEWRAEMLTQASADDPLERLAASVSSKVPKLSAPEANTADTASTETAGAASKKKAAAKS